jgi:hypothetical protein
MMSPNPPDLLRYRMFTSPANKQGILIDEVLHFFLDDD